MPKSEGNILIIDDDEDVLMTARMILRPFFKKIRTEKTPKTLERILSEEHYDVVILDMNFKTGATSGNEGLFWLRQILELDPAAHVIMNTAYGDIPLAVESMKKGAIDFLSKPWEKEKLLTTVKNVYALRKSKAEIEKLSATRKALTEDMARQQGEMIGESPAMRRIRSEMAKVAGTTANILILGENGTGKDLVAREIHRLSERSNAPFIKVDLAALSPELISSELFGHVRGAFTDAREDRTGRFELAQGGTLFLDEIGNIPVREQSKLLSVLQNRTIYRVGDNQPVPIDIRLITATNMPLNDMITEGSFREDLLYRINTVEIHVPPLRERQEDIPILANHFLQNYMIKYRKPTLSFADETIEQMRKYHWPGNIREMQHAIERAVIMCDSNRISASDLIFRKTKPQESKLQSLNVEEIEKEAIRAAILKNNGNLSHAARELGMGRTTLYRKMERYSINTEE